MRTTHKRGAGRWSADEEPQPPQRRSSLTAAGRSRVSRPPVRRRRPPLRRTLGWVAVAIVVVATGVAGGFYLYLHESIAKVTPRSKQVKDAAQKLDVVLPGTPANALVIGYDHRVEDGAGTSGRSDTLMLVRADPVRKTITMLSLPRDLRVDIICPGHATWRDKINAAYSLCGPEGTVETVKHLTGQPVNYLITVNFRGFRQLIDSLDGVWMDIDRRYYNDVGGPTGYATINIQPGYQRLTGLRALDFVRFRHTDSDLFRNARQQQFVRAFSEQIASSFGISTLPRLVDVVTANVEVGQGGGGAVSTKTVLGYALFAFSLPRGRIFQSRIDGLEGWSDLTTAPENVQRAVHDFVSPDVASPRKATQTALGESQIPRPTALAPRDTRVMVLNGNGVSGSASAAGFVIGRHGYEMVLPPGGAAANAPRFDYPRSIVYYDPSLEGASLAAAKIADLIGQADVRKIAGSVRLLGKGATIVVIVGQTFGGQDGGAAGDSTPAKALPAVTPGTEASLEHLRSVSHKVSFPLMIPTVIEQSSWIDREKPVRAYYMDKDRKEHKAVRLTYRLGGSNEYWGVQMTDWDDAPALSASSLSRTIGGRRYDLYFNGSRLHMVVLRMDGASYWVVNTLLDRISNETMLEIATGLKPLSSIAR